MLSLVVPQSTHAQVTHYSIAGSFTGNNSGDAGLVSAIAPILGTQSFTLLLPIDASAPGSALFSGETLYRPMSDTPMNFAGFTGATNGCTSPGEFICTVHVRNGTGLAGTGEDRFVIFSDFGRSADFNAAVGETRPLDFQFILGLFDFTGTLIDDESLGLDLTQQNLSAFSGSFTVFAAGQTGFDRADFGVRLSAITLQQTVPEPATFGLLLVGLAGVSLVSVRRRARSTDMRA